MKILWYIAQGKIKASSEEYNQLVDIFNENVLSDKNVFGPGYKRLYLKYDRPRRLDRNKRRNKKLRESYNFPQPTLPNLTNPIE